jgi:hypothetical protein
MAEEQVLLEDRGVRITTAKAQMHGTTYPMGGITSVRTRRVAPSPGGPILFGGGGLAVLMGALLVGAVALPDEQSPLNPQMMGFAVVLGLGGLALLAVAANAASSAKARHVVVLGTAGGDRQGLSTYDQDFADSVRSAIEEAITRRG